MAPEDVSSLGAIYDEIAEADADDGLPIWIRKMIDAKPDIVKFTASRCPGRGPGSYLGFVKGSFNLGFRIGFSEGPEVIIRFARSSHSAFRDEKVENEVRAMEYIRQHTTIPVPRIYSWGLTAESPQELGSFIIMEFMVGASLASILEIPDSVPQMLNPEVDTALLDVIYRQIADYLLKLSKLSLPRIGSISESSSSDPGSWTVTNDP